MIGVKTDADRRYAVSTQVTLFCDVCSPAWIVGSTGITSDCSSAKPPTAAASTAKVTRYRVRFGALITAISSAARATLPAVAGQRIGAESPLRYVGPQGEPSRERCIPAR
jgi:hypothetical protein